MRLQDLNLWLDPSALQPTIAHLVEKGRLPFPLDVTLAHTRGTPVARRSSKVTCTFGVRILLTDVENYVCAQKHAEAALSSRAEVRSVTDLGPAKAFLKVACSSEPTPAAALQLPSSVVYAMLVTHCNLVDKPQTRFLDDIGAMTKQLRANVDRRQTDPTDNPVVPTLVVATCGDYWTNRLARETLSRHAKESGCYIILPTRARMGFSNTQEPSRLGDMARLFAELCRRIVYQVPVSMLEAVVRKVMERDLEDLGLVIFDVKGNHKVVMHTPDSEDVSTIPPVITLPGRPEVSTSMKALEKRSKVRVSNDRDDPHASSRASVTVESDKQLSSTSVSRLRQGNLRVHVNPVTGCARLQSSSTLQVSKQILSCERFDVA